MPQRSGRVTLRDIAAETGLSLSAVSYAMRGLHVPPETQRRVQEAAHRLGYQGDPIARALSTGRTGYIAVLCRSLTDPWQQDLAAELSRAFFTQGHPVLIADSSNDADAEQRLAAQLADQRIDALVVLPVDPSARHWGAVADRTVLVALGDALPHAQTSGEVVFDNRTAVRAALDRLRTAGHRRIAVLTPGAVSTPDRPVERVVREYADEFGMPLGLHPSPSGLLGAQTVAAGLLAADEPPSAFFCLADSMAHGVYAAARTAGLDIPTDLSVLGSDDAAISSLLHPPLSGYRWPFERVVAHVIEMTLRAVADGTRSERLVVSAEPAAGASVAPPR